LFGQNAHNQWTKRRFWLPTLGDAAGAPLSVGGILGSWLELHPGRDARLAALMSLAKVATAPGVSCLDATPHVEDRQPQRIHTEVPVAIIRPRLSRCQRSQRPGSEAALTAHRTRRSVTPTEVSSDAESDHAWFAGRDGHSPARQPLGGDGSIGRNGPIGSAATIRRTSSASDFSTSGSAVAQRGRNALYVQARRCRKSKEGR
jgi:hypothetical protein